MKGGITTMESIDIGTKSKLFPYFSYIANTGCYTAII